jgi:hypothetical protein
MVVCDSPLEQFSIAIAILDYLSDLYYAYSYAGGCKNKSCFCCLFNLQ